MSHDSDLEEGEIPNSPSPGVSEKNKDLPRRYILKENKSIHKHKKDCKYAIRYHAKKIAKQLKYSPNFSDSYKKYNSKSYKKYHVSPRTRKTNYKKLKSLGSNISNSFKVQPLVPKKEISKIHVLPKRDSPNKSLTTSLNNNEESEDLEELRRIALASCSNRILNCKQSCDSVESRSVSLDSKDVSVPFVQNKVTDNYEVVDMELDEDIEQDNNNLFIIDTKPSNFQAGSKKSSPTHEAKNEESDDYEEEIMRAELLSHILHKRYMNDSIQDVTLDADAKESQVENTDKPIFKEETSENDSVELGSPTTILKTNTVKPNRFVISIKDESSSDESEQEDSSPANAVASLEALISDARQKSSLNEKVNDDDVGNIPKALSCLSRAQQKEYSNLMKMLAKKNVSQKIPENNEKKNSSQLNDLKILEEKLRGVKENLLKEKELMTNLSKEMTEKWNKYVKSKLAAQQLKEKLSAADEARREKLAIWSKSYKNFQLKKKYVSSLEKKKITLQNLYSKVGSSIQG